MKGTSSTNSLVISIFAMSVPGSGGGLTAFSADALAYYKENQRNAKSYMPKVTRENAAHGLQKIPDSTSAQINGLKFMRADFAKPGVHETVLVLTHNGYAFVFIFTGSDVRAADQLIASTVVKLTN